MTLNGAIMQLVELSEHPIMPVIFRPAIQKVIETISELEENPEPHWIPVDLENNEPQLEEWVLVSSDGYVMQDCIVERGGEKIWYHGGNIQADDRYMPLPEPYKGVTE